VVFVPATQIRIFLTSTLLAVSGVFTVAASAQRWWPACRIGAFDSNRCPELQDHLYDYINPSDPERPVDGNAAWVPLGSAAELHGVGMLVLAVAVLLLPWVLAGRWPGWKLTIAALVVSAGVAVAALPTLLSGLEGEAVSLPHMWLPQVLLVLGIPALLIVSAMRATPGPRRVEMARWTVVLCLAVANNMMVTYLMAMVILMYGSYDTTPWTEAIGGVLLIGASIALWLSNHHSDAPHVDAAAGSTPPVTSAS
jgi:hypothetical protein